MSSSIGYPLPLVPTASLTRPNVHQIRLQKPKIVQIRERWVEDDLHNEQDEYGIRASKHSFSLPGLWQLHTLRLWICGRSGSRPIPLSQQARPSYIHTHTSRWNLDLHKRTTISAIRNCWPWSLVSGVIGWTGVDALSLFSPTTITISAASEGAAT